jgi:O-antigen ligase
LAAQAILLIILAIGLTIALPRTQLPFRRDWIDVAMLVWVGVVLLSCIWSVNLHRSLLGLAQILCYSGVFFLGRWLSGREERTRLLLGAVGAGAFISAIIGLESYLTNVVLLHNAEWRTFGPFINPNAFAGYLLVAIPALLFLALNERSDILRGCLWVMSAAAVSALFLTGSKGGILAGLVTLGVLTARLVAQAGPSRRRARLLGASAVALLVLLAVALAAPPIRQRLISAGGESHSALFRVYTWLGALRMASAHPLLGWGAGTFDSAFAKFAVAGYTRQAHNDYLQMGAETGLLGLAAYLLILVGVLYKGWKMPARGTSGAALSVACWAAALGFCLHSLVDYDFPIIATGVTVWLLMGIGSTVSGPIVGSGGTQVRTLGKCLLSVLLGVSLLLSAYALASAYADSQRRTGEERLHNGRLSSALSHLHRAELFAPLDSEAHRGLARALEAEYLVYRKQEDLEQARSEAQSAVALDPMRPVNWTALGRLEEELKSDLAEKMFQRAASLAPNDPKGWLTLAEMSFRRAMSASSAEKKQMYYEQAFSPLRRIERIESGPAVKVQAIPDLVDLTFSRARLYTARQALEEGQPEVALAKAKLTLEDIKRYQSSKSVEALKAIGEEPYHGVEMLSAMALLVSAEAKMRLGEKQEAEQDRRAAVAAWSEVLGAFQSFMKGGTLL